MASRCLLGLLLAAACSAQKLSVVTYSVGGTPKNQPEWRANSLATILNEETSDVIALQDTSLWFNENVVSKGIRSKWKIYNMSKQGRAPPRLVILSKYAAVSEELDIIDPEVSGFTTYMQTVVFKVRASNGIEEKVQVVNTAFSSATTAPNDGNKVDRMNHLFAFVKAKLDLNSTVIICGNLDFGDEGPDASLNQALYTKMDQLKFIDSWPTVNTKDAGYTLDYERNKNTVNRADNGRASKYEHKALRADRMLIRSNFITPDRIRLIGTEQKADDLGRNTGVFPSDHFGLSMGLRSKDGEFTYGMPVFAIIFFTLAACVCLGGIGFFAYSHINGDGGGSAEENQKLTGDNA